MKTKPAITRLISKSSLPWKGFKALSCTLLWLAGALAFGNQAQAGALYAATSAGGPGELYILNATSGAVITDVGPLNDSSSVNYPISGLAFHPVTRVLYGSTGNSVAATAAKFVTIDPATARVTVIGSFNTGFTNTSGTPSTMSDLAFDPTSNILYGIGSIGGPHLYSINLTTGKATQIGSSGLTSTSGGGIAISSTGVIYGTPTASRFGTYDKTTGALTAISTTMVKPLGGSYAALAFNENGVLFGQNSGSGTPPPCAIVTIDPATAAVTNVGASVDSLDAIAFQPSTTTIQIQTTGIRLVGGNVEVTFTALPAGASASSFKLQKATLITNTFTDDNSATITDLGSGTFRATTAASGAAQFYRIKY
jgi:hypothetical protein